MKKNLLLFFLFNMFFIPKTVAHGDLHERIVSVTKEIKAAPDSSYLYLKRAKLFYQHESYIKSVKDLKKSKSLGHNSTEQKLLFAKVYFKLEDYKKTLLYTESILTNNYQNVRAIKIKAQTYLQLENFCEAAVLFENVIEYSTESFPENYIDASKAWELQQTEDGYNRAIAIIQKGIENKGHLITLHNRLIELAIAHNDYDFAITEQLEILKLFIRKETAYYKLSELYQLNNNSEKALQSLIMAKEYYNNLPIRLQNNSFMKKLIANINNKEKILENK